MGPPMLKLVLVVFMLVPLATIITTYTLSQSNAICKSTLIQKTEFGVIGKNGYYVPFISASIDYSPESCIGTFGLSITALIAILLMIIKHAHVNRLIRHKGALNMSSVNCARLTRRNIVSLVFGMIGMIGLFGVVAFQYHNVPIVHLVAAGVFFASSVTHISLIAALDSELAEESKKLIRLRIFIAVSTVILFFPFFVGLWFHTQLPQNLSASAEILCTFMLFSFFLTYYSEFRRIRISIEVDDSKVNYQESIFKPLLAKQTATTN